MTSRKKRIITCVIAVILVLAMVIGYIVPALAEDLDDLYDQESSEQQEYDEQEALINATEEEIAAAQAQVDAVVAEMEAIDKEIADIGKTIIVLNGQIDTEEQLLAATEAELAEQQEELKVYYQQFKGRIQMMYENDSSSYLEILLQASSIADFFSRLEYISAVVEYDNNIIHQMDECEKAII
ncbi:MAG: hypothetical protein II642_04790, partial [Firmicutes bacterium]|nr:hypothetical protein [Bacillota bacterium]